MSSIESRIIGLSGKSVIVTGAAAGIGEQTTLLFASLGANVLAVSRRFNPTQFSELSNVEKFVADVSVEAKVDEAVVRAVQRFGGVDILVNNAGIILGGSLLDFNKGDWDRVFAVNLGGYRDFARAVAKRMIEQERGGKIVNVTSVDGMMAEPRVVAYSASKGAIIMLTKTLAMELAPYQIRVNSIAPGWVDTKMGTGMLDEESRRTINKRIPLGYIAPAEEIARSILYLASDMSKYMTGHIMVVDGGLSTDISIPGLRY
jgi:3-oxoacyl-[acyl-carrier protein] reductase